MATSFTTTMTAATGGGTSSTGYMEYTPDDVLTRVKTYMGGTVTDAAAMLYVVEGLSAVMQGLDPRCDPGRPKRHVWSFLQIPTSITFWGVATGTMSVSTTTITDATNKPFLAAMVGQTLVADTSGTEYTISTYVSTSVITVTATAAADNGDTFTITPNGYYSTPTGFRGIKEPPVCAYSSTGTRYDLKEATPEQIRAYWREHHDPGIPRFWALENLSFSTSTSQTYRFMVAPVPSEDVTATFRMLSRVADPISGGRFPGGDVTSAAIFHAAMAACELERAGVQGVWTARATASLISAIDSDKATVSTSGPKRVTPG
jgi:hypothetical protein